MNELEIFSSFTLKQGGIWYQLEESEYGGLYKTYSKYTDGRNYYNTTPVFQVFKDGKRLFVSESYLLAYKVFNNLKNKEM